MEVFFLTNRSRAAFCFRPPSASLWDGRRLTAPPLLAATRLPAGHRPLHSAPMSFHLLLLRVTRTMTTPPCETEPLLPFWASSFLPSSFSPFFLFLFSGIHYHILMHTRRVCVTCSLGVRGAEDPTQAGAFSVTLHQKSPHRVHAPEGGEGGPASRAAGTDLPGRLHAVGHSQRLLQRTSICLHPGGKGDPWR